MNLISLKKWDARIKSDLNVINYLWENKVYPQWNNLFFYPSPIPGYGNASGFEMRLIDKTRSGVIKALDFIRAQKDAGKTNELVVQQFTAQY